MELEPFGSLNPLGLADSVFSTKTAGPQPQITVCFRNNNRSIVDIHWINEKRQPLRYAQLKRGQFVVIKTFPKHPWVFREAVTGVPCLFSIFLKTPEGTKLSAPREVYWPHPFPAQVVALVEVVLVESHKPLVDLCVAKIANTIREDRTINNLPLPASLLNNMLDEDFNQEMETLGPEAAVDKFQEILEVFAKDKCITTLSRFYRSINILGYAKLRNAMKEQLPPLVQKLWKEKSNEEACQVARILCYILLLEKTYFDEEAVDDIWKGLFTKEIKSIKKSPVMALLTVLLTDDHGASEILSTHSFPLKMENEADTWEFVQFVNIIRDHKEVLLHVHATVANNMVAQVLNYYKVTSGGEDYLQVIQEYLENKELKNRPDFTRDITSEVKMEEGDSQPELIKEKEQIKLKYLIEVADTRPEKLKDIIKVLSADKCIKLLTKLPSKVKNNEKACALVAKYLIKKLPPTNIDKLLDILIEIADIDGLDPCVLNLCAEFVKASATKSTEREIVTLSLSIASSYNQKDFDVDAVMAMESLLHKCILYAHDSINNDRVALYSLLLIHYFHALQKVVERKDVDETLKENMSYHCAQICRIITQHKIYFQRNVVFIISEILESPFLATYRLHQIADPPSRALLAIGLPPKAKRRYAKLLPAMKNASRFVA